MDSYTRWQALEVLRSHYSNFADFLYDVMVDLLGYNCTDIQLDIAQYLQYGPLYRMIMAQRGQAKTTITSAYAVWRLIHDPTTRVLIISASGATATEIANWAIQIIKHMPELDILRPDKTAGDRTSIVAFDIHHDLKGPEKSPSIASIGITGQKQGKRADLLIADDVESQENSMTATMRTVLNERIKDFASLCQHGDIIYLGTPQSSDSVYNGLPDRGHEIRIYPGRYPTEAEMEHYGDMLAPLLVARLKKDPSLHTGGGVLGDQGKAIDPVLIPEETLQKIELSQGKAYFKLQHMLDTRLTDKDRYPLKLNNFVVVKYSEGGMPVSYVRSNALNASVKLPNGFPVRTCMYTPSATSSEILKPSRPYMFIDPSGGGQNGDETAYAVGCTISRYILLLDVGGIPGGIEQSAINYLVNKAKYWNVANIGIEKNFGYGAMAKVMMPELKRVHPQCGIDEPWASGQKELRIIDTLEPIMGQGRLLLNNDIIDNEPASIAKYPVQVQTTYSFFHQLQHISREKRALVHDDRIDAVHWLVRYFMGILQIDEAEQKKAAHVVQHKELLNTLRLHGVSVANPHSGTLLDNIRRK